MERRARAKQVARFLVAALLPPVAAMSVTGSVCFNKFARFLEAILSPPRGPRSL